MLDLLLSKKEGLIGDVKIQAVKECQALPVQTIYWYSFRSLGQGGGHTASPPLDFRKKTLASLGIRLVDYCGIKPWRQDGPRKLVNIQG